jgi:hypothetical protein
MKALTMKLEAGNLAEATIITASPRSVHVKIKATDQVGCSWLATVERCAASRRPHLEGGGRCVMRGEVL